MFSISFSRISEIYNFLPCVFNMLYISTYLCFTSHERVTLVLDTWGCRYLSIWNPFTSYCCLESVFPPRCAHPMNGHNLFLVDSSLGEFYFRILKASCLWLFHCKFQMIITGSRACSAFIFIYVILRKWDGEWEWGGNGSVTSEIRSPEGFQNKSSDCLEKAI